MGKLGNLKIEFILIYTISMAMKDMFKASIQSW